MDGLTRDETIALLKNVIQTMYDKSFRSHPIGSPQGLSTDEIIKAFERGIVFARAVDAFDNPIEVGVF